MRSCLTSALRGFHGVGPVPTRGGAISSFEFSMHGSTYDVSTRCRNMDETKLADSLYNLIYKLLS